MTTIDVAIVDAAKTVPCYWPLTSFIAYHPLWEMHQRDFVTALRQLQSSAAVEGLASIHAYQHAYAHGDITDAAIAAVCEQQQVALSPEAVLKQLTRSSQKGPTSRPFPFSAHWRLPQDGVVAENVRAELLNFMASFFASLALPLSPSDKSALWPAWVSYAKRRDTLLAAILAKRAKLPLPRLIESCLQELSVPSTHWTTYLTSILHQLLGFAALIKWLAQHPENPFIARQATLEELLAIWLCYECAALARYPRFAAKKIEIVFPEVDATWQLRYLLQCAAEHTYQARLLQALKPPTDSSSARAAAQFVLCIDTRSEGLRRHLEQTGPYETFGFAGFFGFVFTLHGQACLDQIQCPALFGPSAVLQAQQRMAGFRQALTTTMGQALHKTQKSALAAWAYVEVFGLWYGLAMAVKAFFPITFARLRAWLQKTAGQRAVPGVEVVLSDIPAQYSLEQQVTGARDFLAAIGLTRHFSQLVVICGHGAKTENNPFQSSLDCGACGGNSGYQNAQVAAYILNQPAVREGLRQKGIDIPAETHFVAGLHQTTEDHLHLDTQHVPATHQPLLQQLQHDITRATAGLRQERLASLPGQASPSNRAEYWAELIPEMALINNAAFIIGPRTLTKGVDLSRRTFLHSYDPAADADGSVLRAIMLGPVVVAHWISAQYYFSTTDPQCYGSGNKMLHNVIPGVGVMEGNLSDLKIGLPWQSVGFREQALHQPLRLLVVVNAPKARVDAIIQSEPTLAAMFAGQWARLHVLEV